MAFHLRLLFEYCGSKTCLFVSESPDKVSCSVKFELQVNNTYIFRVRVAHAGLAVSGNSVWRLRGFGLSAGTGVTQMPGAPVSGE